MNLQRLFQALERLENVLARFERGLAQEAELSVSQLRLLLHISQSPKHDGARISDLAKAQTLAISTMTRNLGVLQKKGWIDKRDAQQDKRSAQIFLTDEGRQKVLQLQSLRQQRFHRAFSQVHPSERVERAVALDRVARSLESA